MDGKILIVEDERKLAELLADYLRQAGFVAVTIGEGSGAMEAVRGEQPDLILLDLMLPGKDGLEICREVRQVSSVPIIMVTARIEEIDRLLGLELGADDYICKPFSPREVVARVRSILRRAGWAPEPAALDVDLVARRIRYRGRVLDLTRYEFELLRTLAAHPERIFTRSELMERVWAGAEDTADRTVDTHIKTLRAKLRAVDPEADPIQTHRGVGYSLSSPRP